MCPTSSISRNEITAEVPSAVSRMLPYLVGFILAYQSIYTLMFHAYSDVSSFLNLPKPAAEFCQGQVEEECERPDLFAFQVVSGVAFLLCSGIGVYSWHITGRTFKAVPSTPAGRIYSFLPEAEWMATANLAYQIWDFVISLTISEHCTPIMMTHHVVAAMVCWSGLSNFMLGHYSVFFLGLSEVSSVFLVLADLSRYFPPEAGSFFESLIEKFAAPLFVLCFIYYRVILWWTVTYRFFHDVRDVINSGQAEKLRPGGTWHLYLLLALDFPMGLLQLYWLVLILQKVQEMLG